MKTRDQLRAAHLEAQLQAYAAQVPLRGVEDVTVRAVFLRQLIDSLHRVEYPSRLLERSHNISERRTDPRDEMYFDPIRAAVYHAALGQHDEACWLVFLFVTYGKGKRTGWRLIRDVYGRLGQGGRWDWPTASANPAQCADWIVAHAAALWPVGTPRPFGAHRQHEQVAPSAKTIESYVRWIGASGHHAKFRHALDAANGDRRQAFDQLYHDMSAVYRFGRLAKFDYLAMLGKLELVALTPPSTYMKGATGPVTGARLLFANDARAALTAEQLDHQLVDLDTHLQVGMQVLEDALCNWQKNPRAFKAFRG